MHLILFFNHLNLIVMDIKYLQQVCDLYHLLLTHDMDIPAINLLHDIAKGQDIDGVLQHYRCLPYYGMYDKYEVEEYDYIANNYYDEYDYYQDHEEERVDIIALEAYNEYINIHYPHLPDYKE